MYEEFTGLTREESKQFNRDESSLNWPHRAIISEMIVNGTILEVGCGNGVDASRYISYMYTGIDISPPLIEAAKEYNPDHKFKVCDASNICFDDNSFDNVICVGLFESQPNIETARKILSEMVRVARKKVLILWYNSPREGETKINRSKAHFGKVCNNNIYNIDELKGELNVKITRFDECYKIWEIDVNGI